MYAYAMPGVHGPVVNGPLHISRQVEVGEVYGAKTCNICIPTFFGTYMQNLR